MANIDDLIKYENESTRLDFKKIQYKKEKHSDLIKDIMSMANADIEGERYIIVGVKYKSSGDKELLGIKEDLVDSAIYQQLIKENIEPEILFEYLSYKFKGNIFGIFKISKCYKKPYMMKKDFKNLQKGDCYIRKGTHQCKMTRRDFDLIIEKKLKSNEFSGEIQVGFSGYNFSKEIELATIGDIELPSQRAAKKIRKIIKKRKQYIDKVSSKDSALKKLIPNLGSELLKSLPISFPSPILAPFISTPYEQRSLTQLEKNLKEVEKTYREDDLYEAFELNCHKLNIRILNKGQTYIEDASIQLEAKKIEGFRIVSKVYEKPKHEHPLMPQVYIPSYESQNYPKVNETETSFTVFQEIGDIKHKIPINAFKVPIRVFLAQQTEGKKIELKCTIFGKNLREPFKEILTIKVIPNIIIEKTQKHTKKD